MLYGQILAVGEVLMLVGEDIAQLVGQAWGVANSGIDAKVSAVSDIMEQMQYNVIKNHAYRPLYR